MVVERKGGYCDSACQVEQCLSVSAIMRSKCKVVLRRDACIANEWMQGECQGHDACLHARHNPPDQPKALNACHVRQVLCGKQETVQHVVE